MPSLTEDFKAALTYRRAKQAGQIEQAFGTELRKGPLLDYGCGYGAFVRYLLTKGVDAYGCDLSVADSIESIPADRFFRLQESWGVPGKNAFSSIALLDVLEHAEDPLSFIPKLRGLGCPKVLVKVPDVRGPIGSAATLAAGIGKPALLERMLLVGDVFPHRFYFSHLGLKSLLERAGYRETRFLRIADVGTEIQSRLRPEQGAARSIMSNLSKLSYLTLGAILEYSAAFWSDTIVALFEVRE